MPSRNKFDFDSVWWCADVVGRSIVSDSGGKLVANSKIAFMLISKNFASTGCAYSDRTQYAHWGFSDRGDDTDSRSKENPQGRIPRQIKSNSVTLYYLVNKFIADIRHNYMNLSYV